MTQVHSTTKTQQCTFCGINYVPKQYTPDAKKFCCGKKECLREYDRTYKRERREAVDFDNFDAVIERFKPGEEVARFMAVISGGRFMSNGGAQITLSVPQPEKYKLVDVTDYSGMQMDITIRVVVKDKPEDDSDGEDSEDEDGDSDAD